MLKRLILIATALSCAAILTAQTAAKPAAAAAKSAIKRMPDGHPDLQGTYDLATMTPMDRLPGDPPFLSKEQADKLQQAEAQRRSVNATKLDPNRPPPAVGGDRSPVGNSFFERLERGGGGAVGGYDRLWLNQGTNYFAVDGQIRTSIIIDPPDGHVPPTNAAARARMAAGRARPTSDQGEQDAKAAPRRGEYDNPEDRPLSERCLLGFGSTSGPPMLPDYFYNDLHQIVQTKDSILILTEMIHDARVVRMNATEHLPKNIRRWLGDSIGHWDGDTLVVETTNFTDKTRFRGATENMKVTERFRRMDDHTLLYRFTVEDPQTWDKPWTGEMSWPATTQPILEYACHEGNYALGDVMRGARKQEADDIASKRK